MGTMEYRLIDIGDGWFRLIGPSGEQVGAYTSARNAVSRFDGPDVVVPVTPTDYGYLIRVVRIPELTDMLPVLAYVAGPLRAKTMEVLEANCQRAMAIAMRLWDAGIPAICPHMNTDLIRPRRPDGYEQRCDWIAGGLVMVARSNLLVLAPGWEGSVGTLRERKRMIMKGGPVYVDVEQAISETRAQFVKGGSDGR